MKTAKIEKALYKNYLQKALEFRDTMRDSMSASNWNSVALNAIHAGVSANDAVLTFFHGMRSISPKHDDAVKLLRDLMKDEKAKLASNHLSKLMYAKNLVAYESRLFTQSEAHTIAKHTERFIEWVESVLP